MQRRQRGIRHICKQRDLFFFRGPRRFDHFHQRHFDVYGVVLLNAFFFFDDSDALMSRQHADTPVLARLPGLTRPQKSGFQQFTQPVHKTQPGQSAEHAEAGGDQGQQQQRRAGKAKHPCQRFAQHRAQHSSRCQRQRDFQCIQPDRFERAAGQQQRRKPGDRDQPRALAEDAVDTQIMVSRPHALQHVQHTPPGGKPKQVKQQIGEVRPQYPAGVDGQRSADAMRPGRVGRSITIQSDG